MTFSFLEESRFFYLLNYWKSFYANGIVLFLYLYLRLHHYLSYKKIMKPRKIWQNNQTRVKCSSIAAGFPTWLGFCSSAYTISIFVPLFVSVSTFMSYSHCRIGHSWILRYCVTNIPKFRGPERMKTLKNTQI